MIETAIVVGVMIWLGERPVPETGDKPVMEISLVTLPPAPQPPAAPPQKPPPPPPQSPPPPVPAQLPLPQPVPTPKPPPPKPAIRQPKHVPKIVKPAEPPRPAAAAVQYPSMPAPVQRPQVAAADAMASFDSEVRAAIQAAVSFPFAAQNMHQYGQARVAFDYFDGVVSDIHIVQSSGFPLLDPAALAAVRTARYPSPPPEARGRVLHYVVSVRFQASAEP